jgi:hypothetical protein
MKNNKISAIEFNQDNNIRIMLDEIREIIIKINNLIKNGDIQSAKCEYLKAIELTKFLKEYGYDASQFYLGIMNKLEKFKLLI